MCLICLQRETKVFTTRRPAFVSVTDEILKAKRLGSAAKAAGVTVTVHNKVA